MRIIGSPWYASQIALLPQHTNWSIEPGGRITAATGEPLVPLSMSKCIALGGRLTAAREKQIITSRSIGPGGPLTAANEEPLVWNEQVIRLGSSTY